MLRVLIVSAMLVLAVSACKKEEPRPIPASRPVFDVEREVGLLKSILAEDPANVDAWTKLGNVTMDSGRFEEAVEAYGKALELDPGNTDVRVDMGTSYRRMGRSDLAVENFRKAIEADPDHPYAHMNLGVVLAYDFNKKDEAIRELERYLELAPTAQNAAQIRQEIERLKAAN